MKPDRPLTLAMSPIIVGALVRIVVVARNPHSIIWDEVSFHELAKRLAQGESYGVPFWPPGWPYLIAAAYRVFGTTDHRIVLWFNVAISVATLILFGLLTARLFSRSVATVAVWLMALMPSYSLANGLLIYEVWMQFLLIAVMYVAARGGWSWPTVIALAVLCGLLTLIRPTWIILPVVLWLMNLVLGHRSSTSSLLFTQLGVIVLIAPWLIYASSLSGRFVPISLQGGLHLWMANNPDATGTHMDPPAEFWNPQNEAKAREAAVAFIMQNPHHLVQALPARVWYMFRAEAWTGWFFAKTEPPVSPRMADSIMTLSDAYYYAILLLSILGIGTAACSRRPRDLGPLIPFGYSVAAQIALFTGQFKYRWPVQFILIMYAALAIVWIAARWQNKTNPT